MNFKASGHMESHPSLKAKIRMDPVEFDASATSSFDCEISALNTYIGEIGVRFAIPFMRPRRKLPLVASVGGFHIRLRPFHVRSKGIALRAAGVFGTKGVSSEVDASVACQTRMDVEGTLPVKLGRIHMDLCEAEERAE
jgi:hypothetical protein